MPILHSKWSLFPIYIYINYYIIQYVQKVTIHRSNRQSPQPSIKLNPCTTRFSAQPSAHTHNYIKLDSEACKEASHREQDKSQWSRSIVDATRPPPFCSRFSRPRISKLTIVTLTNYDSRGLIAIKSPPWPIFLRSVADVLSLGWNWATSWNRLARDGRIESMILDTRTIVREIETS